MKKLFKSIPELVKNALVLMFLLVVTLLFLEVPKHYYVNADEALFEEVTTIDYSIVAVNEQMNLKQKIEACISEDSIVFSENNPRFSRDELVDYCEILAGEADDLLILPWNEILKNALMASETIRTGFSVQIVRLIDEKIYSFELGIIDFELFTDDLYTNGTVLFDMETGKILVLQLSSEEGWLYEQEYGMYYYDFLLEQFYEYYSEAELLNHKGTLDFDYGWLVMSAPNLDKMAESQLASELERLAVEYLWKEYDYNDMIQE